MRSFRPDEVTAGPARATRLSAVTVAEGSAPLPGRHRPKTGMDARWCALLLLPFLALASHTARADWTPLSAKALAAMCHATGDATKHAQCLGYVSGIYDLQFAPKLPAGVCPPANLDPDLLAEVVTAYLDTHEDGPAADAIGQSVVRFFPCAPGAAAKKP